MISWLIKHYVRILNIYMGVSLFSIGLLTCAFFGMIVDGITLTGFFHGLCTGIVLMVTGGLMYKLGVYEK